MGGAFTGPFLFDDVALIHGNHHVHSFEHWTTWVTGTLWDTNYDPSAVATTPKYWRPAVLASYAVDWFLGDGSPLVFHLTNLLIHAANGALVFNLMSKWVSGRWSAWLGSALFAVHPVQTEAVAFIAGRTDSLCLFGLLMAIHGIRHRQVASKLALTLQLLGICIAFASKEEAVVLPVLACIEWWAVERRPLTGATIRRMVGFGLPYLGVSLAFLGAYMLWIRSGQAYGGPSGLVRIGFILEAWGRYTALLLWPDDLTLGRALVTDSSGDLAWRSEYAVLGGLTLAVIACGAWRCRRRLPAVSMGLMGYVAMLVPVTGVVWLGYSVLVSPRFLYVPMLGASLVVAGWLATIVGRPRLVSQAVVGVVLLAFSARAFVRSCDYDNEETFWRKEIVSNPGYQSAQQYFVTRELKSGRPRSALHLAHSWFQAGGAASTRSYLVLNATEAALALTPDVDRLSLAEIRNFSMSLAEGKPATLRIPALKLQLTLASDPALMHYLQVAQRRLYMVGAEAASRLGDDDTAVMAVRLALRGCERCWTLLPTAAITLARAGRLQDAETLAQNAAQYGPPNSADGVLEAVHQARAWREQLGMLPESMAEAGFFAALGAYGRAHEAARSAIESPPDDPHAVRALAELAFRAGDVKLAERLLALVGSSSAQATAILEALAKNVTWRDQPKHPETWVPDPSARGD